MSQRKRKRGHGSGAVPVQAAALPASAEPAIPATGPVGPPPAAPRNRSTPSAREEQHWVEVYAARAEQRNAEARARLVPLAPDEHPWALRIAVGLALIFSLGTLGLMIAGVKVDHKPPATSWIFYVLVMLACAIGMWRHWFQAVLAFMCLLGIALVILCALVVRFSNLLGLLIPLVLILAGGTLFWKLVGVLARLQMPERRARST